MTNPDTVAPDSATSNVFGLALGEILDLLAQQDPANFKGEKVPEGLKYMTHFVCGATDEMIRLASLREWLRQEHNRLAELIAMDQLRQDFRRADDMPVDDADPDVAKNKRRATRLRAMYNYVNSWVKLEAIAVDPIFADKSTILIDEDRNLHWAELDHEAYKDSRLGFGRVIVVGGNQPPDLAELLRTMGVQAFTEDGAAPPPGDAQPN